MKRNARDIGKDELRGLGDKEDVQSKQKEEERTLVLNVNSMDRKGGLLVSQRF